MLNVKIEEQLGDLISLVELYGSSTEKEGEPTHYIGPDKIGKTVYPYTKISQAKVVLFVPTDETSHDGLT